MRLQVLGLRVLAFLQSRRLWREKPTGCINSERPISKLWSDCFLALIPKPNKALCRPENLRPLGIQDVAGKSLSRILKQRLIAQVGPHILQFPQFAYVSGRSTEGAIARVVEHCNTVREELGHCKRNIYSKRDGHKAMAINGGIQLAVDMSTAFDRVPRSALRQALVWAGASAQLIEVIDKLHDQCDYHIQHAGFRGTVNMKRGVRQGCTLAPVLFAIFSCFLADLIGKRTDYVWMQHSLTLYADDTHASWTVRSESDLLFVERCILAIHATFTEYGMVVNPQKSVVICSLFGRLSKQWCRNRIQKSARGYFLCVGPVHQPLRIPIQSSMVYLGVVVSYGNYELQTMKHRLRIANCSRQRLIRILHSSRHLTIKQRLEMYMACVRSSAIYGLPAVGFTTASLNLLRTFEQKHIRAMAKSPVHLTRETTSELYLRLGIKEPDSAILCILQAQCRRSQARSLEADQWRHASIQTLMTYIAARSAGLQHIAVDKSTPCPTCGQYFANRTAMRQHHKKIHKVSLVPVGKDSKEARNKVVIHEHALDGMPICRRCGKRFENFTTLKAHALDECAPVPAESLGSCDRSQQSVAGPALQYAAGSGTILETPLAKRDDVIALLGGPQWQEVLHLPGAAYQLRHHCGVCGQWLAAAPSSLSNHVRSIHAELWSFCADAVFKSLTLSATRSKPCTACGARTSSKTNHRCFLMIHLCFLELVHKARTFGRSSLTGQHGFQRGRPHSQPHRRGQGFLSTYFLKGRCGQQSSQLRQHSGELLPGRAAGEILEGECQGRFGARQGPKPKSKAKAKSTARVQGGQGPQPGLVQLGTWQLESGLGECERGNPVASTYGSAARGRIEPESSGTRVRSDDGGAWRWSSANPISGGPSMEGGQREGSSHFESTDGNVPCSASGVAGQIGEDSGEGSPRGSRKAGHCPTGSSTGAGVALLAMGSGGQKDGQGSKAGPSEPQGIHGVVEGASTGHCLQPIPASIPQHSAPSGELSGRDGHLSVDPRASGSVYRSCSSAADVDVGPGLHEGGSVSDSTCKDGETTSGQGSGGAVPAANKGLSQATGQAAAHQGGGGGHTAHGVGYGASSWKLSNPNNLCYLNSVVSALLGNFQFSGCDFTVAFGTLRNAFQAILSARVCFVPALFHWHNLLSRWPHLTVQQDAAEFLDFVLRSADPAGYLFSWEARRQHREVFGTRIVTTDSGQGFHPLVIDICSGGLQQCVDDWHMVTSSSIYALRCAPRFLFLQLRRYTQRRGAVLKSGLSVPIHPGETIWMPLWEEGIELRYVPYSTSSAIFHLGATLDSGHYRTALSRSARDGSLQWYLTDDGVFPAKAKSADLEMLYSNVYIVGLSCSEH